jgi:hypothetical protein
VLVYKSKTIKKKDVQSTLTTFGNLSKAGAKESMQIGKSLWKRYPIVRRFTGLAVGLGMIGVALQPIPPLFGFIGFGFLSVSIFSGLLGLFGALLAGACLLRIFK